MNYKHLNITVMKTLESIFSEIKEAGVITKRQIQLLKSRSNRQQKDVIDYAWLESIGDGYGIPLTEGITFKMK